MGQEAAHFLNDLPGLFVEHHFPEQVGEGGGEQLHLLRIHCLYGFFELVHGFGLGSLGLLPEEADESVDVGVVVLDDFGVLNEGAFLFGDVLLGLEIVG